MIGTTETARPTLIHPVKFELSETISEVHHYTDWSGLQGIYNSGTLFATRYDNLNDTTEVLHCKPLLISAIEYRFKKFLLEWQKGSLSRKRHLADLGGAVQAAKGLAKTIVDALYLTSFGASKAGPAFAVPYISSFCGFDSGRGYERENGLLSQWRGYGGSERFAVVFDTKKLEGLIDHESVEYAYAFLDFGKVIYNDSRLDFAKSYEDLVVAAGEVCKVVHATLPHSPNVPTALMEKVVPRFLRATCLIKHQGFAEESEARIVAAPLPEVHLKNLISQGVDTRGSKVKPIDGRTTSTGGATAFIRLFNWNSGKRLPINRIIVGPQRNQDDLVARVSSLVGSAVLITRSQTPYTD